MRFVEVPVASALALVVTLHNLALMPARPVMYPSRLTCTDRLPPVVTMVPTRLHLPIAPNPMAETFWPLLPNGRVGSCEVMFSIGFSL